MLYPISYPIGRQHREVRDVEECPPLAPQADFGELQGSTHLEIEVDDGLVTYDVSAVSEDGPGRLRRVECTCRDLGQRVPKTRKEKPPT